MTDKVGNVQLKISVISSECTLLMKYNYLKTDDIFQIYKIGPHVF